MKKLMAAVIRFFSYGMVSAFVSLMTASVALADTGVADATTDIRKVFRHQLLASIGDAFLNNGILDWSGNSLLHYFFATATAVAIFQVFYRHYGSNSFLLEWAKIPFFALVAMSILGGWDGYQSVFSYVPSGIHQNVRTLDKDVYYYLADRFDTLAGELDKVGGPDVYASESAKLFTALSKIQTAVMECKIMGDTTCIYEKIQNIQQENNAPTTAQLEDPGVMDTVKIMAKKVIGFLEMWSAPLPFWILQVVVWILELVRMFINYFTLIVFALITAMGLFFCKIFTVFLVLPDFRGRIWNAYKMPLSASMYGFLTSLIISCSTVIIRGINEATISSLSQQALSAHGLTTVDLMNVLFGSALATSAILFVQILSMSKVPGLCRKLWDLSLDELVEFGKTIIEAGLGAVKAVGGLALGVGAIGAVGAASAVGAAANGAGVGGAMKAGFAGLGRGARAVGGQGMPQGGLQGLLGLQSATGSAPSGGGFPGGGLTGGPQSGGSPSGGGSPGGGATGGSSTSGNSGDGISGVTGGSSGGASSSTGAGRIGLKGKGGTAVSDESDDAELTPAQLKAKAKKDNLMSDGVTQKPQTLAEAKSAKRWAMANHAFGGAMAIGRGLGGLVGAGMGAAFGQDHNVVGQLVGGAGAATMGIGAVHEAHSEHAAVKEELVRKNSDEILNLANQSSGRFAIDEGQATEMVSKFQNGTATADDRRDLNKMVNNGEMGDLYKSNESLHTQLMTQHNTPAQQEWRAIKKQHFDEAMSKAVIKKGNKVVGIDHDNSEDLKQMMADGFVTDDDLKHVMPVAEHITNERNKKAKESREKITTAYKQTFMGSMKSKMHESHSREIEAEKEAEAQENQQAEMITEHTRTQLKELEAKNTYTIPSKPAPSQAAPPQQSSSSETVVAQANPTMGMKRPSASTFMVQNDAFIKKVKELTESDAYQKMSKEEQIKVTNSLLDDLAKKK